MPVLTFRDARRDLIEGARSWRVWSKFAWHDLQARYRRSWMGPLWLVVTALVYTAALTLIYGTLFSVPVLSYLPFVAVGVACWGFINALTSEATTAFVEAESYIRQMRINLFIFVFRVLWRNFIVFLNQFAVALLIVALSGKLSITLFPLVAIGVVLMFVQGLWIIPLLGLLGTRFRDLKPIVTNLLQVLFFVTPIIWLPAALGSKRWIADINPLTSIISVVRDPLLGHVPTLGNYAFVLAFTAVGLVIAAWFYIRFHKRIVYWL